MSVQGTKVDTIQSKFSFSNVFSSLHKKVSSFMKAVVSIKSNPFALMATGGILFIAGVTTAILVQPFLGGVIAAVGAGTFIAGAYKDYQVVKHSRQNSPTERSTELPVAV